VVALTTVVVSWVDKWDRIALNPSRRLGLHHQWEKWNDTKQQLLVVVFCLMAEEDHYYYF
jgi:hypothetical protein